MAAPYLTTCFHGVSYAPRPARHPNELHRVAVDCRPVKTNGHPTIPIRPSRPRRRPTRVCCRWNGIAVRRRPKTQRTRALRRAIPTRIALFIRIPTTTTNEKGHTCRPIDHDASITSLAATITSPASIIAEAREIMVRVAKNAQPLIKMAVLRALNV